MILGIFIGVLCMGVFIAYILKDCMRGNHDWRDAIDIHPNGKDSLPFRYKRCQVCGKAKARDE